MFEEYRCVVHFCYLRKLTPQLILEQMEEAYGSGCVSISFIYKWIDQFRNGRETISDLPRAGRPLSLEKVDAIKDFIEDNPSASCRCIAKVLLIDKNTVKKIIIEQLHLKRLLIKWVPHQLTNEHKHKRVTFAKALLSKLNHFSEEQLKRVITCDESWFFLRYYADSIWTDSEERPQFPRRQISDVKFMFFTSFSLKGLVYVTMLPPGERFNSSFMCTTILPNLKQAALKIPCHPRSIKVRIHLDNARPHNSKMTQAKINELNIERLEHPPFSPDISPNDFFLYGYIKEHLKGMEHKSCDELFKSIVTIIENIDENTWKEVFEIWKEKLKMVIEAEGNYL